MHLLRGSVKKITEKAFDTGELRSGNVSPVDGTQPLSIGIVKQNYIAFCATQVRREDHRYSA